MLHLCKIPRIGKVTETESRREVNGAGGMRRPCFMGTGFSLQMSGNGGEAHRVRQQTLHQRSYHTCDATLPHALSPLHSTHICVRTQVSHPHPQGRLSTGLPAAGSSAGQATLSLTLLLWALPARARLGSGVGRCPRPPTELKPQGRSARQKNQAPASGGPSWPHFPACGASSPGPHPDHRDTSVGPH